MWRGLPLFKGYLVGKKLMDIQLFYDSMTVFLNQSLSFFVGALMSMAFAIAAR